MKPTPVHRFYFSQDEVVAALFPSGIPSKARELRFDGDELVVDFVNPVAVPFEESLSDPEPSGSHSLDGSDVQTSPIENAQQSDQDGGNEKPAKIGENETEARDLCSQRGFQTFLEVRTEEAAQKILLERCKSPDFRSLDTEKYKKAAFRDVVGEFEVWLRGD